MSVGQIRWPSIHPISGLQLGVAAAGIKHKDRNDVLLISICPGSKVVGVFTQNAFCAEPVKIAKQHLTTGAIRALIINSGNANACSGRGGFDAAITCCNAVAQSLDLPTEAVLPFSTGVIGVVLPAEKIVAAIPEAVQNLSKENWLAAAKTIMTTDTHPKGASVQIVLNGNPVNITGIAKGAGMIKPDMATMLAFIATDANVSAGALDEISRIAANRSFNRITIDGDTSTNDACMLIATGTAAASEINQESGDDFTALLNGVIQVYCRLAQLIVRDGEGATKFIEVDVRNGHSAQECLDVGYTIAHSPLIKTAFFASDPNWGRIVAAVGNAGIKDLNIDKVRVWLGDALLVENGGVCKNYREEDGQRIMRQDDITISVDLQRGEFQETIWTTDLSHEYIKINAEYRT